MSTTYGTVGADSLAGSTPGGVIDGAPSGAPDSDFGNDTLRGFGGGMTLFGRAGDDSLVASDNSAGDRLYGGDGNDVLYDGARGGLLEGGAGDDTITAVVGNFYAPSGFQLTIRGGADDDSVTVLAPIQTSAYDGPVSGDDGNDTIFGANVAPDNIDGGAGDDSLVGGGGNDKLVGGGGADTILGGDGDDTVTVTSVFAVVDGGDGTDVLRLDASASGSPLIVPAGDSAAFAGFEQFEMIGTSLSDSINGTAFADTLDGGSGGQDTLYGGSGNDLLRGYAVDDAMFGEDGNDTIVAINGFGALDGGGGIDLLDLDFITATSSLVVSVTDPAVALNFELFRVLGSAFADSIVGSAAGDTLFGGGANDTLVGGGGFDFLAGGGGNDVLSDSLGGGILDGLAGDDTITGVVTGRGRNAPFTADGGTGNDSIAVTLSPVLNPEAFGALLLSGGDGNDTITGSIGLDSMVGGNDNDLMVAGLGNDTVKGDAGADTLYGAGGNDSMLGGEGNDALFGGIGNDSMDGGAGADSVSAGDGNDTLAGGAGLGADTLLGAAGNDIYLVSAIGTVVVELANEGTDEVRASITFSIGSNVENLTLTGTSNIDAGGSVGSNVIVGNSGINSLFGSAGADTLNGASGNDSLNGGSGADSMVGGFGDDQFMVDNVGDVVIEAAGQGTDSVLARIDWTLGANTEVLVMSGATNLAGTGNGAANRITGGTGSGMLRGLAGIDELDGGEGADTLEGGTERDLLTGGTNNDTFLFANTLGGNDRIQDFTPGADIIAINAAGFGGGLTPGALDSSRFVAQATPSATTPAGTGQFIYETDTAILSWDADGSAAGAATAIATLNIAVTASDFLLV